MSELGAIRDAVTGYFDRRPNLPQRAWDSWLPGEHAFGFTVARSTGFDILDDIKGELRKAIRDGVPFEEFRKALEPTLKAKGWWGVRESVDPTTGRTITEQLGSARRLDLIYDANIRSAQAAGEWIDLQANKDFLPWLEYVVSLSERKRPQHRAWVGTTLPVDDPWWRTHYPPNGWRCKCRTRPRSEPREDLPPAKLRRPPLDAQPWVSKSTGQSRLVPKGIDPGWDNNAGLSRQRTAGQELVQRIERMGSDEARRAAVAALRQDPAFDYIVRNEVGFVYGTRNDPSLRRDPAQAPVGRLRWPVAILPEPMARALGTGSNVVSLSAADSAKIIHEHREITAAHWARLQEFLDGAEFTRVEKADGKLTVWRRDGDGRPYKLVVKLTSQGEMLLNSWYETNEKPYRRARQEAGEQSGQG